MTTLNESYVNSFKINRLTKTQLNGATELSPSEAYWEDPEFVGGKLLETTADGDIIESSQTIPTKTSDLTNDSGFITGITSGDVTTALGYTPYDASNPNGYTSNTGTVTSVNNVSPVSGNVTLSIPTVNDSTITIQKNGTTVDSFTTNASSNKSINITVPTSAADVNALPSSTKYGADLSYSSNTLQLKDQDGNNLGNAVTISGGGSLPSQTGQSGKFLTTDGTDASWGRVKTNDLFDSKWTDYLLNDQNWLRADTFSWQDGTAYSDAYDHLVDDYTNGTSTTETVGSYTITYVLADDGHKITTDETNVLNIYNESGVAWYYVLDTANTRFKLPRENPAREELINLVKAPVRGTGMALGLTNGTNNYAVFSNGYTGYTSGYGVSVGSSTRSGSVSSDKAQGVTTDPTKSGIETDLSSATTTSVYKGKQYLYFYVGQFSQSATEQTAGLNSELFNSKVDIDGSNATFAHIVETYSNGTDWYYIRSDNFCMQGGVITNATNQGTAVSLLRAYKDTNYIGFVTVRRSSNDSQGDMNPQFYANSATEAKIGGGAHSGATCQWCAMGYIS